MIAITAMVTVCKESNNIVLQWVLLLLIANKSDLKREKGEEMTKMGNKKGIKTIWRNIQRNRKENRIMAIIYPDPK